MAVDPQDSDTFDEPARRKGRARAADAPGGPDDETPEADAAEQRAEVGRGDDETGPAARDGAEADPADAAEQARAVEQDEDEYR